MSLLQMSFHGAVIILVIIVIRSLCMNRLPKVTFLALWVIVLLRLLVPFSVPSEWSFYSLAGTEKMTEKAVEVVLPEVLKQENTGVTEQIGANVLNSSTSLESTEKGLFSPWVVLWAIGTAACSLYFSFAYYRCYREFQMSLPVSNQLIQNWTMMHKLKRKMKIKQSDSITAPLTYGILHPVILMPKNVNWKDTQMVSYILTHEWIHIRRFDTLTKLVLIVAVCVHWFNPFVWIMYLLFNRDLELSCDEQVVKLFGEGDKSTYALTLIHMEEKRSNLTPLCNNFSKNAIEERIAAIMKIRKTRILTIVIAVIVVVGMSAVFLTSASNKKVEEDYAGILDENDIEVLSKFQFDDFENMTVSEYREKAEELVNDKEYKNTYDKLSQSGLLHSIKDINGVASFYCYNIEGLLRGDWKNPIYPSNCEIQLKDGEKIEFHYKLSLHILEEDILKVGELNKVRETVGKDFEQFFEDKTIEEITHTDFVASELLSEAEKIMSRLSTENLNVSIEELVIPPLNEEGEAIFAHGSREDYDSLLSLKAKDYDRMFLEEFNQKVLDWCNEDYYRMERISMETVRGDYKVTLTEEEKAFVEYTIAFSEQENANRIKSLKKGEKEEDPGYQVDLPDKEISNQAWCRIAYDLYYHIADKTNITVGERDKATIGMIQDMEQFWKETDIETLLTMNEDDIEKLLRNFAEKNSTEKIQIIVNKENIFFEHMDERYL